MNDSSFPLSRKRRFLTGILGGKVDCPPVGSVTSVANLEQMELTGAFFPDAHLDCKKMAALAAGAFDILGYDAIMPYFSVQAEAAALGCQVDWGDRTNLPVERSHPWTDPEQVSIPPDFLDRPSIRTVLVAIRILWANYGDRAAIVGKVMGPWTLAYHTHGVQDFLIETIDDPARVRRWLERLKEITIIFGKAQIEAGAHVLCIADHATGDLVSSRTYRDFLLPFHRELTQAFNCPTVLHICGNTLDRLNDICTSGFNAFHFDSKVDARKAVERAAGRIALMGNVNNPEVLLKGTPEAVAERTRYALAAGVNVVGPECAVPLETPLENLKAIRIAARTTT